MATQDIIKYLGQQVKFIDRPFADTDSLKHIEFSIQGRVTDVIISLDETNNQFAVDDGDYYNFSEVDFIELIP